MRVSKVELVEAEYTLIYGREKLPWTFFSLDHAEQAKYNTFRQKHNDLEETIHRIRQEGKEIKPEERQEQEREISSLFVKLIKPYLDQTGLEIVQCFAGYGEDKKTLVETPYYVLFENKEPFDAAIRVVSWFSTKDETLSCMSNLDYRTASGSITKSPERRVTYDILKRVVGEKEQDGLHFPFVSFRGDFVYFASSAFAVDLIKLIRDILEKVGPGAMEELNVLYREYMSQRSYGEVSNTTVQQRVFKEAYERKLETELRRTRFIEQKLTVVK